MGLDLGLGQCVAPFEGVVDQGFDGLHGLRSVAVVWPQRVHAAGAEAAMNSPTFGTDRRYIDRTSILPHPTAESEMSQIKVAVLVGSLRMDSFNRRLARAVEKLAPAEFAFRHIQINDLPLYSQDFDAAYPASATRLKKDIESVDALLFVTPEYNRSIPGVLKNAIDIASRPWGDR